MVKRVSILNKRSELKDVPTLPGVYFFEREKEILYIGKAKNLKSRLSSYFLKDLNGKTKKMVAKAKTISHIPVNSELEALLLEAKLVKLHKPKYNIELRDDKHPLYIKITNDEYSRIITARKAKSDEPAKAVYGPFPSSTNVHMVLRMLRRIFPYCDHKLGKRVCLRSQIGLCNPCPNIISSLTGDERTEIVKQFKRNIRLMKGVLDGRIPFVRKSLIRQMKRFSDTEKFEEALVVKRQLESLEYITQPIISIDAYLKNPNFIEDVRKNELMELQKILLSQGLRIDPLLRVECYDIAHLGGDQATASMITFVDGIADKKLYRHFKIRQKKSRSDTDSMREVIKRRLKHLSNWGTPDLIIVDGGKPQVSVFVDELSGTTIPIIGIAKRFETLIIPQITDRKKAYKELRVPKGPAKNLVQRMRDEAHRFARRYHHKLLSKNFIPQ